MESDLFRNNSYYNKISSLERMRLSEREESFKDLKTSWTSAISASQELGSFSGCETTLPSDFHASSKIKDEDGWISQDFDTNGTARFGFRLHNDADQDGASLEMVQSSVHLSWTIPPKAGSKWFSKIEGESVFVKQKGFASTQMTVGYRIIDRLCLLYDWGTVDASSYNSYGMEYERGDTKTQVKIQYPRHEGNATAISFLATSKLRKKLLSHFHIGYDFLSRDGELFYNPRVLQLGLKTHSYLHEINHQLPQLSCYIDAFHKLPFQLDYIQSNPEQSSAFQVSCAFSRQHFQIQAFVTRFISEFHKFSIGIGHASFEGLSWILKWQMGDICLDIPILLSNPSTSFRESMFYSLRCAYFGILSQTIHNVIGEALFTHNKEDSNTSRYLHREQQLLDESKKNRIEAERQQMVMKKKAESIRRSEEKNGGLLIEHAIYAIENGDSIDVTVALQFWVYDSQLVLHGNNHTFGNMLGFYDIRSTIRMSSEMNLDADRTEKLSFIQTIKLLWETLMNSSDCDSDVSSITPYIYVRYRYNDKLYEVRVEDDHTLVLPNPQAKAL